MTLDFTALIDDARNPNLDDETRLFAVMAVSAANYKARARELDMAVERPGQPQQGVTPAPAPTPTPTPQPQAKHQGKTRGIPSIKDFLMQQLLIVDHHDGDGRPIGLRYDIIERRLREKFPVVLTPGAYQGRPPSIDRKGLHELAFNARKQGYALPFRPRARNGPRHPLSAEHKAKIRDGNRRARLARRVQGVMAAVEATDVLFTHECAVCRRPFRPASLDTPRGLRKPPLYCSPACRMAAFRQREAS